MQDDPIVIDRSILEFLPDPTSLLLPIMQGMGHPTKKYNGPKCTVKCIGGLHNLSTSDKLRWCGDSTNDLLLIESKSDRCEFYPQASSRLHRGYRIQMVSFINTKKGIFVHSHHHYHDTNSPQPAIVYSSSPSNMRTLGDLIHVFVDKGIRDSGDFWNRDNNSHNYNVYAKRFTRNFPDHDYLNCINFREVTEKWKDDDHVQTKFKSMQVVLKNPRTPEDEDPESQEWLEANCKHRFFPFQDEPFEDETDEFRFLTDMAW